MIDEVHSPFCWKKNIRSTVKSWLSLPHFQTKKGVQAKAAWVFVEMATSATNPAFAATKRSEYSHNLFMVAIY